ncbi:MAG: ABC transporter ATP-binding protein [Planctomycetales bacterium]|nr:ABC transporter ATP-binding protein [Planctomycetales bacterium]
MHATPQDRHAAEGAQRVLEAFAASAHIQFDRIVAGRVLSESGRAITGDDAGTWARRLVEAGESLNLRVRYVECTLADAMTFVQQGTPVAHCSSAGDGTLHWFILRECKGRKTRVTSLHQVVADQWMTSRKVIRHLGLESPTARTRWVIGQPALSCQAPGRSVSSMAPAKKLSPLSRLLGFLRPEKNDLWAVLVFSLVVGMLALATPVAVEALVNTVAFGRYLQPVIVLALLLFTFLAFAAAMRGFVTYVVELFQRRLFIRVVEDLAYRLPRARQQEFDNCHGPELVNRFFDIVTVQKAASSLLLDGLAIVLQTVIGMIILAFYHPFLLGFDVVLLALIGFTVFGLGRGAIKTAIKESKAKYAVAAWLEELTRHPTAFKLNDGNQFALERADQLAVTWLDARRGHFRVVLRQILFAFGLQAVAATALLGLGGWLVILGELTLGQLVAAELIVMMIVGSFAKLGKHMESFYDLLASIDQLGALFDLRTEAQDNLFHLRVGVPAGAAVRAAGYQFGGKSGLNPITMQLEPGEAVALVGRPGSGKSTLVDLLAGLRTPSAGHVELDGIDLRELRPDSLREHVAVTRGVEIFHGSVGENVHLNRTELGAEDVRDALKAVGLLDELLQLPEGLNTMLQTGGAPLSASQATRLMLARAIVGRPRLLLIDSTLDSLADESLAEVLASLTRDNAPWTLLVATGRRAILDACDRVISLDSRNVSVNYGVSETMG